jgi:hypothetical protein
VRCPLARAYVDTSAEARPAIVATYEWQRLVTALLFDVFGFCMLSVWTLVSSLTRLHSGRLPKGLGWFGIASGVPDASFALGFVTRLSWLGESGIGMLSLLAMYMDELVFRSAHDLAQAIRQKQVSSVEVVEAHLAQIARHNPALNAIVTLDEEGARRRAQ